MIQRIKNFQIQKQRFDVENQKKKFEKLMRQPL